MTEKLALPHTAEDSTLMRVDGYWLKMILGVAEQRAVFAAEGWLALGDPGSAREELQIIPQEYRRQPPVLKVEFSIFTAEANWSQALRIAEQLFAADDSDVDSWVNRSFALHELKHTAEAERLLAPALELFPDEPIVPYNLACYACAQGEFEKAKKFLERALSMGDREELRQLALADPDLSALWKDSVLSK